MDTDLAETAARDYLYDLLRLTAGMRYLYERGRNAKRRVMHLSGYDERTGQPSMVPLCGRMTAHFNTTSTVPLGRPICKRCLAEARRDR